MEALVRPVTFASGGERCAADLYLPQGVDKPPIVVMGHGLGGLKNFRIPAFAERFVDRGLAVLAFDYRHWGGSAGEPRQLLSPRKQLEDWHAALACAYIAQHLPTRAASVFTVHNLAYQGLFSLADFHLLGLPARFATPGALEYHGQLSCMKAGLKFADAITTVSGVL